VFKVDGQAYNASIQAYYNAVRPNNTADWNFSDANAAGRGVGFLGSAVIVQL
jgi:hypothetical protein